MLLILNYMFPIMLMILIIILPISVINIYEKYNNAKTITFKTLLFPLSLIAFLLLYMSLLFISFSGHENNIYKEHYLENIDNSPNNLTFKDSIKGKINKYFNNMDYKIHILDENNHMSELDNNNAIIGVKELKKEGNDILVKLDIIDKDNLFKNKIALLNQKALSSITENIYDLNNSPTFVEFFPHVKSTEPDTDTKILNEKQDIDTIKKLISNK